MSRLKLGFLGVGWIGFSRLEAMLDTGLAEAAAFCEPSDEAAARVLARAPDARRVDGLNALLAQELDALVIATPSAAHADQAIAGLQGGLAVFCQKPLGRTAAEVQAVVDAARAADRLLAVDLSYRFTAAMQAVRDEVRGGGLGRVFAADLTFHNAYGPDKPWFFDPAQSGGGCLMDLGVHLVDLALWCLDFPEVTRAEAQLFSGGAPLADPARQVEDYAVATLTLADGAAVRLACSWNLQAGFEAEIGAAFYGTAGGVRMTNPGRGFYDLQAERLHGTAATPLATPPDSWSGRAGADFVRRLAAGARFDPANAELTAVAQVLDRLYGR